jgi:hypothetical protein
MTGHRTDGNHGSGSNPSKPRTLAHKEVSLAKSGVGVEKVGFAENRMKMGDRKCIREPRKSFIGHPDVTQISAGHAEASLSTPTGDSTHNPVTGEIAILQQQLDAVAGDSALKCAH